MLDGLMQTAAGAITGVASGLGIGGGTLLMIWMTLVAGIAQSTAQGINLLYFIPTSAASLVSHFKNGYIDMKVSCLAAIGGTIVTVGASLLATSLEVGLLKRCFGGFLVLVGIYELFRKGKEN